MGKTLAFLHGKKSLRVEVIVIVDPSRQLGQCAFAYANAELQR